LIRVRHRQHGIAKVLIEDPLPHVEDQRHGNGAIETGVGLGSKGPEGDHKTSRIDASFDAVKTALEIFRQIDADGRLDDVDATEKSLLLHAVASDTGSDAGADDLA